jgi:hypothetical protein
MRISTGPWPFMGCRHIWLWLVGCTAPAVQPQVTMGSWDRQEHQQDRFYSLADPLERRRLPKSHSGLPWSQTGCLQNLPAAWLGMQPFVHTYVCTQGVKHNHTGWGHLGPAC